MQFEINFDWWRRKTKWNKRLSSVLGFFLLLFCILAFGVTAFINGDGYKLAVTELSTNAQVTEQFGESLEYSFGYFDGFSISLRGGSGDADFVIKVSGADKSGLGYVAMTKTAGVWEIDNLNILIEGQEPLVLVGGNST